MKKTLKTLLTVFAVSAMSVFALLGASCNGEAKDWLDEKVDQLKCEHEFDDGLEIEPATCSEYGKMIKTCTVCYYEKTERIDKLEHTEEIVAAEAPTCTENGKTDGVVCSVCDEIIVRQKLVSALGHDVTILESVEPTCTTAGKTEGQYCNRCEETVVKQKYVSALGHKIVTVRGKAATCTESGLTDGQKCARCETVYVEQTVIPAKGHNFKDGACIDCASADLESVALKYLSGEITGTEVTDYANEKVADNYYMTSVGSIAVPIAVNGYQVVHQASSMSLSHDIAVGFMVSSKGLSFVADTPGAGGAFDGSLEYAIVEYNGNFYIIMHFEEGATIGNADGYCAKITNDTVLSSYTSVDDSFMRLDYTE